ncbi:MAG: glutaredoxin, partial [Desulfobacca sp.]|nr:glutaredoxin [Desulfobacca sp.]
METKLVSRGLTERRLSLDSVKILEALETPLSIKVLVTSTCPFCARVIELVNQFTAASPLITASIINADLFPEVFRQYRPKAAPTTILNEEVFLTGV